MNESGKVFLNVFKAPSLFTLFWRYIFNVGRVLFPYHISVKIILLAMHIVHSTPVRKI